MNPGDVIHGNSRITEYDVFLLKQGSFRIGKTHLDEMRSRAKHGDPDEGDNRAARTWLEEFESLSALTGVKLP